MMDTLTGKYPAIVKSYDQVTRLCRVEIPGVTDGGDVLPLAEIEYSIGDKSKTGSYATEIEILAGDTVWVEFIAGDVRYPIITGYRNPQINNSTDWRRWHHANIQQIANSELKLTVGGAEIKMIPTEIRLTIGGSTIIMTSAGVDINGTRIDLN